MIIKKTYAEDDWIVLKLTDLWMLGETYTITMTKHIEVLSE